MCRCTGYEPIRRAILRAAQEQQEAAVERGHGTGRVRAGVIDVHAHWLPRELLSLPPGPVPGGMHDRDGQLFLGDHPLFVTTEAMTDIEAVLADTPKAGLGANWTT